MAFEIDVTGLLKYASNRWDRISTLIIALLLALFIMLSVFSGIRLENLSVPEIIVIVIVLLLIVIWWRYSQSVPKADADNIGIGIAITCETQTQQVRIAADFVESLRKIINQSGRDLKFQLVVLDDTNAKKIRSNEDAVKYRNKCRCKYLIWGTAKEREIKGKRMHVMQMEGLVSHGQVPSYIQHQFSSEFAEVFPRRLHVACEDDLLSLEFTAELVDIVTRYILGIAALLSGDLDYSEKIFTALRSDSRLKNIEFPAIIKIRKRLPMRLANIYEMRAISAYNRWKRSKNDSILGELKQHIVSWQQCDPISYKAHLLHAIWYFIAERNILEALKEIEKAQNSKDVVWLFSKAFLLAYQGELEKAKRLYLGTLREEYLATTIVEVEEFIAWLLEKEPDKIQYYFLLGILNWKAKCDFNKAIEDFNAFIRLAQESKYKEEIRLSKDYIHNIESEVRKSQE